MEKKYTISQVSNGYIITPDYKENLNRKDLRVFNEFSDMTTYLYERFNEDLDKTAADKFADDITTEDHNKLKEFKANTIPILRKKYWSLGLSVRTHNCLLQNDEVKDILCYDKRMLFKIKNFGAKCLVDLETVLLREGLTLVKNGKGDKAKANLSDKEFWKWYSINRGRPND